MAFTWSNVVNNLQTTLDGAITDSSPGNNGLLTVIDTTNFPASGYLDIDTGTATYERVRYVSIENGTQFRLASSLARGSDGTNAYAHSDGVSVELCMGAAQLNELRAKFDATTGHSHNGATDEGPKLTQANTHESADTNVSVSSLHHTIGTSATEAAAGNHAHDYVVGPASAVADNLAAFNGTSGDLIKDSGLSTSGVSSAVSASHTRQHSIVSTSDHTSTATSGKILKADANGLPIDATNTDTDVADAVTKKHVQQHSIISASDHTSTATAGNILKADANGLPVNATNTDAQVSSAVSVSHARQHSITSASDHTSTATSGKLLKADASGLPIDATNTDTDVADAVTKKHPQQHSIVSTSDHTSAATPGQLLKADASGLPVDATNTDAQVASAVSASHSAVTLGAGNFAALSLSGQELALSQGAGASQVAAGNHTHDDSAGGHIHGIARWIADGATTTFELPDFAEYIDWASNQGAIVDALNYSLSANSDQIVFDVAPTDNNIVQAQYVIQQV